MENQKTGLFEVSPGNLSIMRAAFAWLIVNGTAMGWYTLVTVGVGEAIAITGAIFSVATGLKLLQKEQEKRNPDK